MGVFYSNTEEFICHIFLLVVNFLWHKPSFWGWSQQTQHAYIIYLFQYECRLIDDRWHQVRNIKAYIRGSTCLMLIAVSCSKVRKLEDASNLVVIYVYYLRSTNDVIINKCSWMFINVHVTFRLIYKMFVEFLCLTEMF